MNSRRLHAMLVALPALALATGATALGGLLVQSIRGGDDPARTVLIALVAWPMAVASVSFLGRGVRALRDSGRPDPVRTLGITPVGGAWRIPMRRRHPLSSACLAVAAAGGIMAALGALGVLATLDWWHVALSVGSSVLVGFGALAVMSALGRDGRASMVLDPRERVLIVPRVRGRSHVVRINLDRIRAVVPESHGMGLLHRVTVEFDDDMLGPGVRQTLLRGVDPGRAMDLVSWVRGFAASAAMPAGRIATPAPAPSPTMAPAPVPASVTAPAPAPAPIPAMHAAPAAPAALGHAAVAPVATHAHATAPAMASASPPPAAIGPARPIVRPRRGVSLTGLVGRINMPAALSGLGLACVLAFMGLGLRMQPQQSSAAVPAAEFATVGTRVATLGVGADGATAHLAEMDAEWIWTIDVSPSSGVSDQQVRELRDLQRRFGTTVRFRVVLVNGDRGGEMPDARLATRYAGRMGLPVSMVLFRPEPGVAVPRHRLIDDEGRVVIQDTGFMSAGSIERQIGVMSAAARMEDRP